MDDAWFMLLFYFALAVGVSFLCSLLEASLLSLPPSYVSAQVEKGGRTGRLLQWMKTNIDRPLAAILTLNTCAHTFGAAGVGAEAAVIFGEQWIGVVSIIVTIAILLLSEIIPKTLGAVYARGLSGFMAYTVMGMIYATYPLVIVCEWLSRLVSGGRKSDFVSRDEVLAMSRMAGESGGLSAEECHTIGNMLRLRDVTVKEVMTPRSVLFALPEETTVAAAVEGDRPLRFARVPLYRENLDHLTGLVHRYRVFEAYTNKERNRSLAELAAPLHAVPEVATLDDVLPQFIQRREQLFQVADEYGGTAGVLTLEDVLETLLGAEIVDETDPAIDMRELARRLLRQRERRRLPKMRG